MEELTKNGSYLNKIAKSLAVVLAISVLGILVYCAQTANHQDNSENKTEKNETVKNPDKEKEKEHFMPSTKAMPVRILPKKNAPKLEDLKKQEQKKQELKKKKQKKDIFIPSSKSGVFIFPEQS